MTNDSTYGDVYIWGCDGNDLLKKYEVSYAHNARLIASKYFLWTGNCPTCFAAFIPHAPLEEILELVQNNSDRFSGFTVAEPDGTISVPRTYQKHLIQVADFIPFEPLSAWLISLAHKQAPLIVQIAS